MFRNRSHLRRWAARVLAVWLFGVVAGVANAYCAGSLFQPDQAVQAEAAMSECEFHAASPAGQHAGNPDAQGPHAGSNCQTFCDAFSVSISPLKSPLDNPAPHAMAPAAFFAVAPPVAGASPVHLLSPRRDGGQAPAITIAFLRLAL